MSTPTNKSMEERAREAVEEWCLESRNWTGYDMPEQQKSRLTSIILRALQEHESAEVTRLTRGDFTSEEFQYLCHNLHEKRRLTPQEFCDGCERYQQQLFGQSPIAQLRADLERAQARCERGLCSGAALFATRGGETIDTLRADLERARQTHEILRRDLADPPADIQELVIKKLNLVSAEALARVEQEKEELRKALQRAEPDVIK